MYKCIQLYMILDDTILLSQHACGNDVLVNDVETGERICKSCGLVLPGRIEDTGAEWRSFSDSGTSKSRVGDGTSIARHDMGLSTMINPTNKDSAGNSIAPSLMGTMNRLRLWDNRSQNTHLDRHLKQAFNELYKMKDKLGLPENVTQKAAYIYRKTLEKKLSRGRTISSMMAAALYAACRDSETPRTLKDVSDSTNIKKKDISRCYRLIVQELDLKMPVVNSIFCISRISSKLGLSEKTKRTAIKLLKKSNSQQMSSGKDPMGLAATALYLASINSGENFTQKDFAVAANVTEVTIRNRSKSLKTLFHA